jgi:hypothetical protein
MNWKFWEREPKAPKSLKNYDALAKEYQKEMDIIIRKEHPSSTNSESKSYIFEHPFENMYFYYKSDIKGGWMYQATLTETEKFLFEHNIKAQRLVKLQNLKNNEI